MSAPDHNDRFSYYALGNRAEEEFVRFCRVNLGMDTRINPRKAVDPTVPDLIVNGRLAELKTQRMPFFTSHRYGIKTRVAVVLNEKDVNYYARCYPDLDIYFWVDWQTLERRPKRIRYLGGVWLARFPEIVAQIEAGAPLHIYQGRQDAGNKNAFGSYVFNVRSFVSLFETGSKIIIPAVG